MSDAPGVLMEVFHFLPSFLVMTCGCLALLHIYPFTSIINFGIYYKEYVHTSSKITSGINYDLIISVMRGNLLKVHAENRRNRPTLQGARRDKLGLL